MVDDKESMAAERFLALNGGGFCMSEETFDIVYKADVCPPVD